MWGGGGKAVVITKRASVSQCGATHCSEQQFPTELEHKTTGKNTNTRPVIAHNLLEDRGDINGKKRGGGGTMRHYNITVEGDEGEGGREEMEKSTFMRHGYKTTALCVFKKKVPRSSHPPAQRPAHPPPPTPLHSPPLCSA